MNNLLQKILDTIDEYKMFKKNDKVIVGVSGGPDSLTLLLLLNKIKNLFNLTLSVAHLNHCIRKESKNDEIFVKNFSVQLHLPFYSRTVNILNKKKNSKKSLEEIAREERYKFFFDLKEKLKADKIALGHNLDDSIETFFFKLLNGQYPSGIPPLNGCIIRPLIRITRNEIEEFLKKEKINPCIDKTNYDTSIPRNWIRHELIPFIEKNFKPVKNCITLIIDIIEKENQYMELLTEEFLNKYVITQSQYLWDIIFDYKKFKTLHLSLQRRIIKKIFERLKNEPPSYKEIIEAVKLLNYKHSFKINKINFAIYNNLCLIMREKRFKTYELELEKEIEIPYIKLKLTVEILDNPDISKIKKEFGKNVIYLTWGRKVKIRTRREGDRIKILNTDYIKKLKDLFIDLKIPAKIRDIIPIIEIDGKVAGIILNFFPLYLDNRISDEFKIIDKSKKVIKFILKEGR